MPCADGERFFHIFHKFGNNWRYVSIFGGVLSLFVKFSRSKKIKFVKVLTYLGNKIKKIWKIEKLREKKVEIMGKKLSDKNALSSKPYKAMKTFWLRQ